MRLVALFDDKITVNQFVKKSREIVQEAFKEYSWITYAKLGQKICVTSTDEAEQQLLSFFDNRLDTNGITVGTIHSKKGATVDGIMVVGDYDVDTQTTDVSEWLKSAHPSTGLCDEPKRIAYVAMTRPRKLLVVAIPYECGNNLIYHSDWKKGGFEYLQLEDVVSTNEKK
jgi:superfamily I DNA/RNA helicase